MNKSSRILEVLKLLSRSVVALIGTVGVVVLLLILAGVFQDKVPSEPQSSAAGGEATGDRQVVAVRLISRPRFESAVGTIEPIHQSSLAAKILAKVNEVTVSAGQEVKTGEVLVRLNDEDLQSRLKQAEAAYQSAVARAEQARADYQRAERLIQGNAISRAEFETAATAVRTSEAEVQRAAQAVDETQVILEYATITAPYDAIVIDKQVQAGDMVSPGQTLMTLYDPHQMQLVAGVRESLATRLSVGQQVKAELESLGQTCWATVREVVPQADVGSRSFQVKVSGPCPPGIYSGMFGRILLPLEDEQVLVIPAEAVSRVGQLTLVDALEQERVIRRHVQLGRQLEEGVEVLSGLSVGEQVLMPSGHASPTSPTNMNDPPNAKATATTSANTTTAPVDLSSEAK